MSCKGNLPVYDLRGQRVVSSQMGTGEPQHGSSAGLLGSLLQQGLASSQSQGTLLHGEWICNVGKDTLNAAA